MKKIMVSIPMQSIPAEEINDRFKELHYKVLNKGYELVNSFITEDLSLTILNPSVWYLSKSIEIMSTVDAVYFCKGWENARGCKIEHEIAKNYGLEIIYED